MSRLLVLAGGFGSRLRPAVSDVPKALAPVADRPFLAFQLEHWIAQGVTELVLLLHFQAEQIIEFVRRQQRDGRVKGCEVMLAIEPEPMGTGGAIAFAAREFDLTGSFLVANADTWLGTGIDAIERAGADSVATVETLNTGRYGAVETNDGRVVGFKEKRDCAGRGQINVGLYHLEAGHFRGWDGRPYSLEQTLIPRLADMKQLKAVALDTDFIDIGIPQDYARFCRWIEAGRGSAL